MPLSTLDVRIFLKSAGNSIAVSTFSVVIFGLVDSTLSLIACFFLQVALLVLATKPWGLMGERIANVPTVRVKVRPEGAMRVLAGTEFPELRLPGMKPGQLQEKEVSSVIPWVVRYFLS